jgi:hypothetical protein
MLTRIRVTIDFSTVAVSLLVASGKNAAAPFKTLESSSIWAMVASTDRFRGFSCSLKLILKCLSVEFRFPMMSEEFEDGEVGKRE